MIPCVEPASFFKSYSSFSNEFWINYLW